MTATEAAWVGCGLAWDIHSAIEDSAKAQTKAGSRSADDATPAKARGLAVKINSDGQSPGFDEEWLGQR